MRAVRKPIKTKPINLLRLSLAILGRPFYLVLLGYLIIFNFFFRLSLIITKYFFNISKKFLHIILKPSVFIKSQKLNFLNQKRRNAHPETRNLYPRLRLRRPLPIPYLPSKQPTPSNLVRKLAISNL